jgi:hypothetical protein
LDRIAYLKRRPITLEKVDALRKAGKPLKKVAAP